MGTMRDKSADEQTREGGSSLGAGRSMRLYKYVSADRIDVLLNGVIRFTQAADFNDPFEIGPYVAAVFPPGHEDEYLREWPAQGLAGG